MMLKFSSPHCQKGLASGSTLQPIPILGPHEAVSGLSYFRYRHLWYCIFPFIQEDPIYEYGSEALKRQPSTSLSTLRNCGITSSARMLPFS